MSSLVRRPTLALLAIATTQLMVVLDASIVNIALPTIEHSLGFTTSSLSWVVNAYTLTFGGFLLLGGRLADRFGRRRAFLAGIAVFTLSSLAGGLAHSADWLVAARAVQGLGAALASASALAIVSGLFPEGPERNRALGVWGAVAGAGGALGVLLGGVLTEYAGWQWILLINVPVGIAVTALTLRVVPVFRPAGTVRVDVVGAVVVTTGLVGLVYATVRVGDDGWGDTGTLAVFGVAVLLLAIFVLLQSRRREPLVALSIFRLRSLSAANGLSLVIGAILFATFFNLTLYLQGVLHYSAVQTGLAFLPLSLASIAASGVVAQTVTRLGHRTPLVAGMVLMAAGLLWSSGMSADSSFTADILGPTLLFGVGLGTTMLPLVGAAVNGVRAADSGLASGLINTTQQVGGALGLAVLSGVAAQYSERTALFVSAVIALSGALLATVVLPPRTRRGSRAGGPPGQEGRPARHGRPA